MIVNNLPALFPLIFLAASLLIPLIGMWKKEYIRPFVLLVSVSAASLSVYGLFYVMQFGVQKYVFAGWFPPIGIEYIYDHLAAFIILLINIVSLIVITHSGIVINNELKGKQTPYYTIVFLLLCGFNGMVLTGDLFNLYVFIEISSLSGYALLGIGDKKAPVAAFRYLIIGTVGASFYLLGLGFLYMISGTLNMADMALILPEIIGSQTVIVALILMVVGIGLKAAIFPMHGWLPDVYTYSPSSSTSLIAPIGTKVSAYVLLRILYYVFETDFVSIELPLTELLCIFASIGIIYGSVLAIAQTELKRMLAYSSIAQIGYIVLGIGLANPLGIIGAVLHIVNHAFMKGGLFLIAANLRTKIGHSDISKFDSSLRKKMPWTMAVFTICALSMIGIPPLAGFFSKWYLVLATIDSKSYFYLAVILFSSLLNAVYFFRILEKVYLGKSKEEKIQKEEVSSSMLYPTLVMGIALFLLGIFNAYLVNDIIKFVIPGGM